MNNQANYPSLVGKVVLVTGAGKGIGQAIAKRFAEAGSVLAVNDVTAEATEETVTAINESGGSAMTAAADVSDGAAVGAMIEAVMAKRGRIDVVVNNAGLVSPMLHFFEADEAWWRRIVDRFLRRRRRQRCERRDWPAGIPARYNRCYVLQLLS